MGLPPAWPPGRDHGRAGCGRCEAGSGTAIGVAVLFPVLMMVIVSLQMLTASARIEQALQSAADRAARTASLCCYRVAGTGGAEEVAKASIAAAEGAAAFNNIHCNNDFVGDSTVEFIAVDNSTVGKMPDAHGRYRQVPAGRDGLRLLELPRPGEQPGRVRPSRPQHGAQSCGRRVGGPLPVPYRRMRRVGRMRPMRRMRRVVAACRRDERGDYAIFIAVIASALLLLGSIAWDGPRLITARQHAVHEANEAARVAAATIASGGTLAQATDAAEARVDRTRLVYGQDIDVIVLDCVGSRVQITVASGYRFRSVLGFLRNPQPIVATGAAEARLVLPSDAPSTLHYLGECPLA